MWFEAILIGIFIGLIRGGRLDNLGRHSIKGFMLIVVGLIVQLIPFFMHAIYFIASNAKYFLFIGLILPLIVFFLNWRKPGMWLIITGAIMQLTVLYAHDFSMPIKLSNMITAKYAQMKLAIVSGQIPNYMLFENSSHWSRYLGKIWFFPDYYPFTKFIGIPDILIALGVIWLIQSDLQIVRSYGMSPIYHYKRHRY